MSKDYSGVKAVMKAVSERLSDVVDLEIGASDMSAKSVYAKQAKHIRRGITEIKAALEVVVRLEELYGVVGDGDGPMLLYDNEIAAMLKGRSFKEPEP